MEPLAAGVVVLVPFPFSDLSQSKLRPAVVLADALRGDFILCQVTSQPYGDPTALPLPAQSFRSGSLHRESYARPLKLFTANERLIVATVASLRREATTGIAERISAVLRAGVVHP